MDAYNKTDILKQYLEYGVKFEKHAYVMSNAFEESKRLLSVAKKNLTDRENQQSTVQTNNPMAAKAKALNDVVIKETKNLKKDFKNLIIRVALYLILCGICIYLCSKSTSTQTVLNLIVLTVLYWPISSAVASKKCNVALLERAKAVLKQYYKENPGERNSTASSTSTNDISLREIQAAFKDANNKNIKLANELGSAKEHLQAFYSASIVPEEFQSFNAMTTLYEYIDSGGYSENPYSIFDDYRRNLAMNSVVKDAKSITDNINLIKKNEYYLYREFIDAVGLIQNIKDDLNKSKPSNSVLPALRQQKSSANAQWESWLLWSGQHNLTSVNTASSSAPKKKFSSRTKAPSAIIAFAPLSDEQLKSLFG